MEGQGQCGVGEGEVATYSHGDVLTNLLLAGLAELRKKMSRVRQQSRNRRGWVWRRPGEGARGRAS